MSYDPKTHSKARLGAIGAVPALPMMPIAAQVAKATGMVHYKLMGESYVRGGLPSMHPASYQTIVQAIQAQPLEASWSGSPSPYYHLDVEPSPDGYSCLLKAGGVTVGRVAVFADAEIVSVDQPLDDQYHAAEEGQQTVPPPVQIPPPSAQGDGDPGDETGS